MSRATTLVKEQLKAVNFKAACFAFAICQVMLPSRLYGSGLPSYELAFFECLAFGLAFSVGVMARWHEKRAH